MGAVTMLEVKGLCKAYHGHQVLRGVSFCLPAGQCLGVAGENGSGKSTLLRLLAQVQRPDGGDVRLGGRSVLGDRKFLRQRVGYVPQENELAHGMTVEGQLKLWLAACGKQGEVPHEICALLGLDELKGYRVEQLSGGMGRRVSIAMALCAGADILIMDEATAGLDGEYTLRLLDWLEGFLRRGGRVIWCSHEAQELSRLCGNCIRLKAGTVVE